MKLRLCLLCLGAAGALCGAALGQRAPVGAPQDVGWQCPVREGAVAPQSEAERAEQELRQRYRQVLPLFFAVVGEVPDAVLLMPVKGARVSQVSDTWLTLRGGGRLHEGQDIFAPQGTPVYSATEGYVYRIGNNPRGGQVVTIVGDGGRRYYYAHLKRFGAIEEGQFVTTDTVIGYVGNTGNARTTPPHLHLGVYDGPLETCEWNAIDPLPLLADRW